MTDDGRAGAPNASTVALAPRRALLAHPGVRTNAIAFLFFTAWQAAQPFISLALRGHGASDALIGLIMGAYGMLPLVLALPAGAAVDRYGSRPLLMLGTAFGVAALALLAAIPAIAAIAVGVVVFGLGHLAVAAAGQAAVLQVTPPPRWDHAIGVFFFSISLGSVVGPLLGGLVVSTSDPRPAFVLGTAFAVAATSLTAALGLPPTRRAATGRFPVGEGLRVGWRNRAVRAALYSSTAAELALAFWNAFFPLLLVARGHDARTIGALFALRAITMTVVRPLLGRFTTLAERPRLLAIALIVMTAGLLATALTGSLTVLALAVVATGVGSGLAFPLTMSLVAEGYPPQQTGLGLGMRLMVNRVGQIAGPFVLALLAERTGLAGAFLAAAAIVGSAVVVQVREHRP